MTIKRKKIKIPIYFGDLHILESKDLKEVGDKYNLGDTTSFDALTFRETDKDGYTSYYICFQYKTDSKIIAHESLHCVRMIFEGIGATLQTNDNDEHQCYLLGWITGEAHKFLTIDNKYL